MMDGLEDNLVGFVFVPVVGILSWIAGMIYTVWES